MEKQAIEIVRDYVLKHLDKSDAPVKFQVYTVWKCKWRRFYKRAKQCVSNYICIERC